MRFERILVATDFSPAGERAVAAGVRWAQRERAALRLVHVAPSRRLVGGPFGSRRLATDVAIAAKAALAQVTSRVDPDRALEVSSALVSGSASRAIARAAAEFDADLVVIGARGEHESHAGPGLGGTAAKLVDRFERALLLARSPAPDGPPVVVAGVDLGPASRAVIGWGLHAAAGGTLHVVHVYELPYAGRLAAYGFSAAALGVYSEHEQSDRERALAALLVPAAGAADVRVERVVERGRAAALLAAHRARLHAQSIVVGRHRRGARSPAGFASVSRDVAQFAPCDVLLVPAA
jgi:universal stress protein E